MMDTEETRGTGIPENKNSLHRLTTRYAEEGDLAEVLRMYLAALNEIRDYIEPIDEDRCVQKVLLSWAKAPCVLLEKCGEIIAFAGLTTYLPAHSSQVGLTEYMFYAKPEHRSLRVAKALSDGAKAVADKFGLTLRMTHMVFDTPTAIKEKFLKRWGYEVSALSVRYGGAK